MAAEFDEYFAENDPAKLVYSSQWDQLEVNVRESINLLEIGFESGKLEEPDEIFDNSTLRYARFFDEILISASKSS